VSNTQIGQLVIQLIIAFGGAWLAAFLTMRLTLKRFYRERTWERKAAAYTVVFEGLHDMLEFHSEHFDAAIERRDLTEDRAAELQARYRKAKDDVKRRIAGETWLLDEQVAEAVNGLWSDLQKQHSSWEEALDDGYGYIANAQQKIRQIARADLELARR